MSVIAFIFARGGSKGFPRKNLALLEGKPLLAWSIDKARACPSIARVIVSTDDPEIAAVARQWGAEVPFMRPADLARDDSPEWLAWQHAVRHVIQTTGPFETFLSVPTTSPLRAVEDLERCIATLRAGDCDAVITVSPSVRNPYFNMVRIAEDGRVAIAVDSGHVIANRQDAPTVYDMTTVAYAVKPALVSEAGDLFDGRVKAVVVPRERSVDIDDTFDLRFAQFLLMERQDRPSASATKVTA
jgi:N-acylneuraminate cytidylyltransferase